MTGLQASAITFQKALEPASLWTKHWWRLQPALARRVTMLMVTSHIVFFLLPVPFFKSSSSAPSSGCDHNDDDSNLAIRLKHSKTGFTCTRGTRNCHQRIVSFTLTRMVISTSFLGTVWAIKCTYPNMDVLWGWRLLIRCYNGFEGLGSSV